MSAATLYSGSGGTATGPGGMKRGLMTEKKEVFALLRKEAQALMVAKNARSGLGTWHPGTREGAKGYREKVAKFGRQVGSLLQYFENKHSPALDIIANDKFMLKYQIYGDIDREPAFGQNTMTAEIPVSWDKCEVEVNLYAGPLDKLMSRAKLVGTAREGIPNRNDVAKSTGWSQDDVRNFAADRMESLISLLEQMQTGQSKLTRLVKGFLILLEVSEQKEIDFHVGKHSHVSYAIDPVCASYDLPDLCYVFNSKPSSAAHAAVLLAMCRAYPPREFQSHVSVPADAPSIGMVSQGRPMREGTAVTLNAGLVYSSILTYAMDTSCTGLLQEAQIIACSLQENRYFSRVGLPKVVSLYDLMVPAFVAQSSALEGARLSGDLSKSVGRVHQMLGLVAAKDIISATYMQSKTGFDPSHAIRQYLNSNSRLVSQMASKLTDIGLFDATPSMRIFSEMDVADYADMLHLSIFEGLWLVSDASACVDNGPISFLVDGEKLMSNDKAGYDVLVEELMLANVLVEHHKMPTGSFTTRWVAAKRDHRILLNKLKRTEHSVEMVRACDYNPTLNLKGHGPKPRLGAMGIKHRRKGSAVPMHHVFRSPPRAVERDDSSSPRWSLREGPQLTKKKSEEAPPAYESGRSSSPITSSISESLSQQESEEQLFEEPELPMQQTVIADAARKRIGKNTLNKILEATQEVKAANREQTAEKNRKIEAMLQARDVQLTTEEQLGSILSKGGLSIKERVEWVRLVNETIGLASLSKVHSIMDVIDELRTGKESGQLKSVEGLLTGNSKHTKIVNELIKEANPRAYQTELSRMMTERHNWAGDIGQAPVKGLKYVQQSQAWYDWLTEQGIDGEERVFIKNKLAYYLAEKASYGYLPLHKLRQLAQMVEGMKLDALPATFDEA
ncbi:capsid protein, partial [Penicillium roseopurpureum chrysovirus 1]